MSLITTLPFEVKASKKFGRYLVAKKDLPAGTLLFQEAPLFVYSDFIETILDNSMSSCIYCYQSVDCNDVIKCIKCKWNFCSVECSENPHHREEECKIFCRNKILPSKKALASLYILRFEILKNRQREKWFQVMSLASKTGTEDMQYNESVDRHARSVEEFLSSCNIMVSVKYIAKVINIFRINGFRIHVSTTKQSFSCLYKICSLFANSCCPNSEWYPLKDREERGTLGILSRRDISAGEMVTISYYEAGLKMGTRFRQESILERFRFACACTRCKDPSELNSFYSAIKCSECPDGWLLPAQDSSKYNAFRCKQCSHAMTSDEVDQIEDAFKREMLVALDGWPDWKEERETSALDCLISNATSQYRLHPNHYLVIESMKKWIPVQNYQLLHASTEESQLLYEKIIGRAERCLAVIKSFGRLSEQVEFDAVISNAMISYHFKSKDIVKIEKDIENPMEKMQVIKKIVKHLKTAASLRDHSFMSDVTAGIIWCMSKRYDVWNKRLLRLQNDRTTCDGSTAIADSPFEIKTSEDLGRHLVAKRDLPGGTLIFEEIPLFVFSKFGEVIQDSKNANCITCHQQLPIDKVVTCSKCKWPFCSIECTQDPIHVKEECEILSQNEIRPSQTTMFCFLDLLRLELLRNKERNKWEEIMSFTSHISIQNTLNQKIVKKQARQAQDIFTRCNISVYLHDIEKMIKFLQINTFGLNEETGRPLRCIYGISCLFGHNCSPNADWYHLTDRRERGTIGILSRRDIAAGEVVDISYCETLLAKGARRRQATILERFRFICTCPRCCDPSELNTFYSGIKCNKCPDGWLLPPTCYSEDNNSRCNQCSHAMTSNDVEGIEETYRRKILCAPGKKRFCCKKEPGWKLDNLISKASSEYHLHPNHYLIIRSITLWLAAQDFKVLLKSTKKSRPLYEKVIERTERLQQVVKRFGKTADQVQLDAIISTTMILYHFKSKDLLAIGRDIHNPTEKAEIIAKIVKHLLTASPLLSHTFFSDKTATTLWSMSKRCDVWKKRLLECKRDTVYLS